MNPYTYVLDSRFPSFLPVWLLRTRVKVSDTISSYAGLLERWDPDARGWRAVLNTEVALSDALEKASEARARELFPDAFDEPVTPVIYQSLTSGNAEPWLYRFAADGWSYFTQWQLSNKWMQTDNPDQVPDGVIRGLTEAEARAQFPAAFESSVRYQIDTVDSRTWLYRLMDGQWQYFSKWKTPNVWTNSSRDDDEESKHPDITEAEARAQFPEAFRETLVESPPAPALTATLGESNTSLNTLRNKVQERAERAFWDGNEDAAEALRLVVCDIDALENPQ